MARPSGKVVLECKGVSKAYGAHQVIDGFSAIVGRGEKVVLVGRNGVGKTTLLKALLSDAPGATGSASDLDAGTVRWGHEVSVGYFSAGPHRRNHEGHDGRRVAAPVRPRRLTSGHPWPARPDAFSAAKRV